MRFGLWNRDRGLLVGFGLLLLCAGLMFYLDSLPRPDGFESAKPPWPQDMVAELERIFQARARAIVDMNPASLTPLYEQKDGSVSKALRHEKLRVRYMKAWAQKRNIRFVDSRTYLELHDIDVKGNLAWVNLWQSLNLDYVHRGQSSGSKDTLGIRTRHKLLLVRGKEGWLIRGDEYTDPLGEDTLVPEVAPAEGKVPLAGGSRKDLGSSPGTRGGLYDRKAAVSYANRYCGVQVGSGRRSGYNPRYQDYTDIGGDCTNFISQVLGDRGGGELPMNETWGYDFSPGKGATSAWAETESFASYLLESNTVEVISRGTYPKVAGRILELASGDLIAYEEKGEIQHFAVVVGRDSGGYPVVNSHTADRYRVPWDLGWDRATVFWLLRVVK